jgi:hypothetical protein
VDSALKSQLGPFVPVLGNKNQFLKENQFSPFVSQKKTCHYAHQTNPDGATSPRNHEKSSNLKEMLASVIVDLKCILNVKCNMNL